MFGSRKKYKLVDFGFSSEEEDQGDNSSQAESIESEEDETEEQQDSAPVVKSVSLGSTPHRKPGCFYGSRSKPKRASLAPKPGKSLSCSQLTQKSFSNTCTLAPRTPLSARGSASLTSESVSRAPGSAKRTHGSAKRATAYASRAPGPASRTPTSASRTHGSTSRFSLNMPTSACCVSSPASASNVPVTSASHSAVSAPTSAASTPSQNDLSDSDISLASPPTTTCGDSPNQERELDESTLVRESHSMLQMLVKRVDGVEKEVKELKKRARNSNPAVDHKKKGISPVIRSETRKMYKMLLDEGEDFDGFAIGPLYTWRHEQNKAVVKKLIIEVQAINPEFQACDISGAAYTYYKSLSQEDSLDRRGMSEERKVTRRRRERILRKLQERQSVFERRAYNKDDKKKWLKILVPEMMSSEESDMEDDAVVNLVKILPWRSEIVKEFLYDLDEQYTSGKSVQAKRQTKPRIQSTLLSTRSVPDGIPSWAMNK